MGSAFQHSQASPTWYLVKHREGVCASRFGKVLKIVSNKEHFWNSSIRLATSLEAAFSTLQMSVTERHTGKSFSLMLFVVDDRHQYCIHGTNDTFNRIQIIKSGIIVIESYDSSKENN